MIRTALLVGFLANVAIAASNIREGEGSIALKSQAAEKLLKSARRLNGQQEEENTWMTKFDLKFHSCYSMTQVGDREGGGGGDEEDNNLYMQHIVKLQLCPSDQCTSGRGCSGGAEYLVNMAEYVQSYVEFKEEQKQQACENVRENCYCNDNQDDQACENQCYAEKGLDYCIENEDNGNNNNQEFNIDEYMECREMENQNNNNNNNNNQYFIGPYCSSNGKNIHLGVFNDAGCVNRVDSSIYASKNYGVELPYSETSIVEADCISCKEVEENDNDNNNNNNNYYEEPKVAELCEKIYEDAAKCEQNTGDLGPYYKSNGACDYIKNTLPKLARVYRGGPSFSTSTSVIFAWIFGITTLGLCGLIYYMYKNPAKVAMAARDGFLA